MGRAVALPCGALSLGSGHRHKPFLGSGPLRHIVALPPTLGQRQRAGAGAGHKGSAVLRQRKPAGVGLGASLCHLAGKGAVATLAHRPPGVGSPVIGLVCIQGRTCHHNGSGGNGRGGSGGSGHRGGGGLGSGGSGGGGFGGSHNGSLYVSPTSGGRVAGGGIALPVGP